jgi:hypothetical protein
VDFQSVSQKLAGKLAESLLQTAALENLAEQLRSQRDKAQGELETLKTKTA